MLRAGVVLVAILGGACGRVAETNDDATDAASSITPPEPTVDGGATSPANDAAPVVDAVATVDAAATFQDAAPFPEAGTVVLVCGQPCKPKTCADFGRGPSVPNCGADTFNDGCGGTFTCPATLTCPPDTVCCGGADCLPSSNICETHLTCSFTFGPDACGIMGDGMGGVLDCGACPGGKTCTNGTCGPCPEPPDASLDATRD